MKISSNKSTHNVCSYTYAGFLSPRKKALSERQIFSFITRTTKNEKKIRISRGITHIYHI